MMGWFRWGWVDGAWINKEMDRLEEMLRDGWIDREKKKGMNQLIDTDLWMAYEGTEYIDIEMERDWLRVWKQVQGQREEQTNSQRWKNILW